MFKTRLLLVAFLFVGVSTLAQTLTNEWYPKVQNKKINPAGLRIHVFHDLEYSQARFQLVIPKGAPGFSRIEVKDNLDKGLPSYLLPFHLGGKIGASASQSERHQDFVVSEMFLGAPPKHIKVLDLSLTVTGDDGTVSKVQNFKIRLK